MIHILIVSLLGWFVEPTITLNIEFTNIKKAQGKLWLAVYRPDEKFAGKEKPEITRIVEVHATSPHHTKFELKPGRYAIAVYHDVNSNGVLDKNFAGIPKEPYGFSKNFRPRFSAPKFEDCAFVLKDPGQKISVKLTD